MENKNLKITILSQNFESYEPTMNEQKIKNIITDFAKTLKNNYSEIKVKLPSEESYSNNDYLIAYLLRSDVYTLETIRINLNGDFTIKSIEENYIEKKMSYSNYNKYNETKGIDNSDNDINVIFATPVDDIQTAVAGVNTAAATATAKGFKVKTLIGKEATVSKYIYWLSNPNVKVFGSIGHGNPQAISLHDGNLDYTFFDQLHIPLNKVIYFNSCQVFNDPLKSSIINAGVQKFIGGITNLLIGPSEEVFKAFWKKTITEGKQLTSSLNEAETETHYPHPGAHGISGNGSEYITYKENRIPAGII